MNKLATVRVGDVIENSFSGEKMVFLQTGAETNGELLQIDLFVRPGGFVAAEHIHPEQSERFVVKSGVITLRMDGQEQQVKAGEEITVPPQTPHVWWNKGEEDLHVLLEFRPAGNFAEYITTIFAWAQAGKTAFRSILDLTRYAVIDRKYSHTLQVTNPPRLVQIILFALLYPVGRLLGFEPDFRLDGSKQTPQKPKQVKQNGATLPRSV